MKYSLKWMDIAKSLIGTKEIPGAANSEKILEFWRTIKRGGIKDDETPWCAAFVGYCLESAGIESTRFESAKSYFDWGQSSEKCYGAVVVYQNHVGFLAGIDRSGLLIVLGGNQENQVKLSTFAPRNAVFRAPVGYILPQAETIQAKFITMARSVT